MAPKDVVSNGTATRGSGGRPSKHEIDVARTVSLPPQAILADPLSDFTMNGTRKSRTVSFAEGPRPVEMPTNGKPSPPPPPPPP
eukprot:CAMPEP_0184354738 /NCGR_PEP_ID=MMETSP1089-20130417/90825_1 /TAXON_ID=38269 ORGANISM="Gloeochaete wittrockiana, Strain SAG46.84" /NCGR_SAMPLE_ID=MMETSP1089 /ASSEMBLY_ACC=CAM_ASM_000445 /LENGTH=83 /DNA_ID=CAMNT_0026690947 /DNA_START=186 /DNA_END=434 /DNA_ORIENTATION=-